MCELLGMSASHPTDINRTLQWFRPRGGAIGPHGDGWGLAYYEGKAVRLFKEANPAAQSACLEFIAHQNFVSQVVIGHIRKANPSNIAPSVANTHPFQRELFGRSIVFAHNGIFPGVFDLPLHRFHPLGESDSEWAFCYLLDRLARHPDIFAEENQARLLSVLTEVTAELQWREEFNYLLSDGRNLFAFGHTNLHALHRTCREDNCKQSVVLLATEPVTEMEPWRKLPGDRITVFRDGQDITQALAPHPMPPGRLHEDVTHSQRRPLRQ